MEFFKITPSQDSFLRLLKVISEIPLTFRNKKYYLYLNTGNGRTVKIRRGRAAVTGIIPVLPTVCNVREGQNAKEPEARRRPVPLSSDCPAAMDEGEKHITSGTLIGADSDRIFPFKPMPCVSRVLTHH